MSFVCYAISKGRDNRIMVHFKRDYLDSILFIHNALLYVMRHKPAAFCRRLIVFNSDFDIIFKCLL